MNKVLFIQKWFSISGGIERVNTNLAKAFAEQGVQSCFYILNVSDEHRKGYDALSSSFDAHHPPQFASLYQKILHLFALIKAENITKVISATETANMISFLCCLRFPKLKVIYTRHCAFDVSDQRLKPWQIKCLYSLFAGSGTVVAVSGDLRDQIRRSVIFRRSHVHFIPNAVLSPRVNALAVDNSEKWHYDNYFIAVGRLVEQKGFDILIRAYALARSKNGNLPHLVILGEGPDLVVLKDLSQQLGVQDSVTFAGFTTNPYYAIGHACAFILSSRHEGMPTVVVEALALNVPVIAFDCPTGPRELIIDGVNGVLLKAEDTEGLADAIANYTLLPKHELSSSVARFEFGSVARMYLEAFDGEYNA